MSFPLSFSLDEIVQASAAEVFVRNGQTQAQVKRTVPSVMPQKSSIGFLPRWPFAVGWYGCQPKKYGVMPSSCSLAIRSTPDTPPEYLEPQFGHSTAVRHSARSVEQRRPLDSAPQFYGVGGGERRIQERQNHVEDIAPQRHPHCCKCNDEHGERLQMKRGKRKKR